MKKIFDFAPIVISGAGIAGLSLSLYFAKYGVASIIFEKTPQLKETGAGLQLSPNATNLLKQLGILDACLAKAACPTQINLINAINNKTIISLDIAEYTKKNKLAPYLTIHRADLQSILLDAVQKQHGLIKLHLGNEIISYEKKKQNNYLINIKKDNGILYNIKTKFLICADGVWSNIKAEKSVYSGYTAWRSTVLPQEIESLNLSKYEINVFMDNSQHLVTYPICNGQRHNLVIVKKEKLHSPLKELKSNILTFQQNTKWSSWPIFISLNTNYINKDGVIFIGDAAHSLLPFTAQGAAMAIEDAANLVVNLCESETEDIVTNLAHYAKKRTQRIKQVEFRGKLNAYAYHSSGVRAIARDTTMHFIGGKKLLENLNWLYKYDALKF